LKAIASLQGLEIEKKGSPLFTFLMVLALLSVLLNIVFSALVAHELQKRGVRINYFLIRLLLPKYVYQYREMTREERGAAGGLFCAWVISINGALVFGVAAVVVRVI
jgi:hypothetical protein